MNIINENEQIRKMLSIVREITDEQPINIVDDNQSENGEKIKFDGLNTVGFYSFDGNSDLNTKKQITNTVGEFIKASGLILNVLNINASDGRIIITSDTIKNPGVSNIKQIKIDTEVESPEIEVLRGNIALTNELINLFQSIITTYNDNQIGREKLVVSTQKI